MKKKESRFPWKAAVTDELKLEMTIYGKYGRMILEAFHVHRPDEPPMMLLIDNKDKMFDFVGGRHIEVLITPSVVRSDDSLKTLKLSDRSCYLEGERKLRFFKVYTKRNCEIECYSDFCRKKCNCAPFDVARGKDSDEICSHAFDEYCMEDCAEEFRINGSIKRDTCSCLPTCDSISYDIEARDSVFMKGT